MPCHEVKRLGKSQILTLKLDFWHTSTVQSSAWTTYYGIVELVQCSEVTEIYMCVASLGAGLLIGHLSIATASFAKFSDP